MAGFITWTIDNSETTWSVVERGSSNVLVY